MQHLKMSVDLCDRSMAAATPIQRHVEACSTTQQSVPPSNGSFRANHARWERIIGISRNRDYLDTVAKVTLQSYSSKMRRGGHGIKRFGGRREYIAGLSGLQERDVLQRRAVSVRTSAHQAPVLVRVLDSTSLTRKLRVCIFM